MPADNMRHVFFQSALHQLTLLAQRLIPVQQLVVTSVDIDAHEGAVRRDFNLANVHRSKFGGHSAQPCREFGFFFPVRCVFQRFRFTRQHPRHAVVTKPVPLVLDSPTERTVWLSVVGYVLVVGNAFPLHVSLPVPVRHPAALCEVRPPPKRLLAFAGPHVVVVEVAEVGGGAVPRSGQFQLGRAVSEVDDVLRRELVRVGNTKAADGGLERGPQLAEPAADFALVVVRRRVDAGLDRLFDEVRQPLGVNFFGNFGDASGLQALGGCLGDPRLLRVVVARFPLLDLAEQVVVELRAKQLVEAKVGADFVQEHSQLCAFRNRVGDEVRLAISDECLRAAGVLRVQHTRLDGRGGSRKHHDFPVERLASDLLDDAANRALGGRLARSAFLRILEPGVGTGFEVGQLVVEAAPVDVACGVAGDQLVEDFVLLVA